LFGELAQLEATRRQLEATKRQLEDMKQSRALRIGQTIVDPAAAKVPFSGGCACGAIRYECSALPLRMLNCHCRDCQLASGSAYSPTVIMARSAVNITKGETSMYQRVAESGNIAKREFCPSCGTPLFASSSARPGYVRIRAASLDDPAWFKPEANVWVGSAQPWDCIDASLPSFAKNRPRPSETRDA
jgi:hypothetical protein